MLSKILGKNKDSSEENKKLTELTDKVDNMNLTEMRAYVNNKLKNFAICSDGLNIVMKKLISTDLKKNRFIELDAMDTKKKKALDLVILIAGSKIATMQVAELIQNFLEVYSDVIAKYDNENKEIYKTKIITALKGSIITIKSMSEITRKEKILGN
ncbi:hypothetical protein JHD48_09560 [Sulfurimonas sp. SAG-AH-194-I05]|nr:hypothetical protein [Sulfurimonas sp. SAG-AH-194-I05]MDF1875981.1 hypothetical protein [Sulfurimonas sp. SAG-AH-194-I05]